MTTSKRQLKLTAFCHPPGHWRMPGAAAKTECMAQVTTNGESLRLVTL